MFRREGQKEDVILIGRKKESFFRRGGIFGEIKCSEGGQNENKAVKNILGKGNKSKRV